MASLSPRSSSLLGIQELNDVLELLKKCGFSETRWFELGLALGLSKTTLDTIRANHPQDTHQCLIECLSKWLQKADAVDSKGGATWDSLSDALRSMDENAIADKLDQEKRPQVLALSIFDKHHSLLSESLSDPVSVARLLNAERVISSQVVNSVEAESCSTLNQRQILLSALREAIQANHTSLQSFAIVLLKVTGNVQLGRVILSNYGEYFPSNDEATLVKIEEVEIPIHKSRSKDFASIRTSLGTMMYNVCKVIKNARPNLNDLKELVGSCNSDLKPKLAECSKVSDVLSLVKEECSLIDVSLLEAVVEVFNVKEAEKHIKEYREKLKKFLEDNPIACCLKEKFDAVKNHPPLNCETITYVFDWRPDEKKLKDITDILSECSGKFVRIRYIDTGYSIAVTCSFPYSLLGVLIARVMENLQFLIKNGLIKLTIGYWTIWEKEKTSQKEIELPQEQDVLLTIKSDQDEHVKLLGLNHQLMDTLAYLFLHLKLCTEKLSETKQEIEPASVAVLEEKMKAMTAQIEEEKMKNEHEAKSREQESLFCHLTKEEQVTEGTVDADQATALTAVEEKDLAISEYRKKYEKTLTLKKGMTFEIKTLKTKEAEKNEGIHQLKEKLKDMERRLQESQDKLNQRDQALALEGSTSYAGVLCYRYGGGDYQWTVTLFVGKSEEAISKYIFSHVGGAQQRNSVATFQFIQPEGVLSLHPLTDDVPVGWTVCLHQSPMKILQSAVDKSSISSVSISVYTKPGIALDPLKYSIKLTGIDPETTIFITRPPPPPPPPSSNIDNTTSTSSTTGASQTSRETEESTFRPDVAYKVMTECTGMIKKLRLNPLVDKLVENRIISESEKDEVTVQSSNLTTDQRMDKLLGFVRSSIKQDGEDFGLFIDIIKQEGTIRADRLAQKLLDTYNRLS